MLIPFALGWAGGYLTWKAFVPTVCAKNGSKGLYGLPKRRKRSR